MFIWATLIPDLISIVYLDGVCQFIIFDAKYYNLQLEHDKKAARPARNRIHHQALNL